MEKGEMVPFILVSVCLLCLCSIVWAGVEPSPFKPQINNLNAVENGLNSVGERVNRVLGMPPDPFAPSPNVNGAVGRLSAMENQLVLLRSMVTSVMDEVLGQPPDPIVPADLLPALEGVRTASQGIADSINAHLGTPPDPIVPEFISALTNVKIASQNIADDAVQYMGGGSCVPGATCGCVGTPTPCTEIAAFDCTNQTGCFMDTTSDACQGNAALCSTFTDAACAAQAGCHVGTCVNGACE